MNTAAPRLSRKLSSLKVEAHAPLNSDDILRISSVIVGGGRAAVSFNDFMPGGSGYGWMLDAECRFYPAEMFFPEVGETAVAALSVCASCDDEVEKKCLEFALEHAKHGVWGGMSERQRLAYKQELRHAKE